MRTPLQGTPEWIAWRRSGIGASEMPAILGADPFRGEWDVLLDKRGLGQQREQTWPMSWGHRVQTLGIDLYHEMTGRRVRNVRTTDRDRRWPHVYASLDGRVVREPRAVEVKWSGKDHDSLPRNWEVQCLGQLGVTGLDAVDLIALSSYREPRIWTVERREPDITDLMEMAEGWYVRYVVNGEDPPVDGSKGAGRHLDTLRGEAEADATREQETLLGELRVTRQRLSKAEEYERLLINQLKASMAATGRLRAPGALVTWAATKGRATTDWQAVATVAWSLTGLPPERYDEEIERHTSIGEPGTRFAVKFEEGEEA